MSLPLSAAGCEQTDPYTVITTNAPLGCVCVWLITCFMCARIVRLRVFVEDCVGILVAL